MYCNNIIYILSLLIQYFYTSLGILSRHWLAMPENNVVEYHSTFADCEISGHQCVIYCSTSSAIIGIISSVICLAVSLGVAWGLLLGPDPISIVLTSVAGVPIGMLFYLVGAYFGKHKPQTVLFVFAVVWFIGSLAIIACGIAYTVTGSMVSGVDGGMMKVASIVAGAFAILSGVLCCGSCACATLSGLYCARDKMNSI